VVLENLNDGSLFLFSALGPKLYVYCWYCQLCFVKKF